MSDQRYSKDRPPNDQFGEWIRRGIAIGFGFMLSWVIVVVALIAYVVLKEAGL